MFGKKKYRSNLDWPNTISRRSTDQVLQGTLVRGSDEQDGRRTILSQVVCFGSSRKARIRTTRYTENWMKKPAENSFGVRVARGN